MTTLRQPLTYFLAATYVLVAVVMGGGHPYFHQHGDCGASCATVAVGQDYSRHNHSGHNHSHSGDCHGDHGHAAEPCDRGHDAPQPSCPAGQHDHSDGCLVCQYLAQQPLPVAMEAVPAISDWCRPLIQVVELPVAAAPLCPHPARGPPLAA